MEATLKKWFTLHFCALKKNAVIFIQEIFCISIDSIFYRALAFDQFRSCSHSPCNIGNVIEGLNRGNLAERRRRFVGHCIRLEEAA